MTATTTTHGDTTMTTTQDNWGEDAMQGFDVNEQPYGYIGGWFIAWSDDAGQLAYTLDWDTTLSGDDDEMMSEDDARAYVDAWIEADVCTFLDARGYRVSPRHTVASILAECHGEYVESNGGD